MGGSLLTGFFCFVFFCVCVCRKTLIFITRKSLRKLFIRESCSVWNCTTNLSRWDLAYTNKFGLVSLLSWKFRESF